MYPNEELDRDLIIVGDLDLIYFADSLEEANRSYALDTKKSFADSVNAARKGNADASASVAHFYLNGTIVDRERLGKAEAWARKAAELDSAYGYWVLSWVLIEKFRPAEGVNAMEAAADLQFSPALYCMGIFYEEGIWIASDINRARQCYLEARTLGFSYASWAVLNLDITGKFGLGRYLYASVARPFAHFWWMIWVFFSSMWASGAHAKDKLSFGNYDLLREMYARK
jgi:TPR repeat protein